MSNPRKDSNPSRPGLVITAVGPDRPGLIYDVATEITSRGANIEDTKMSKLGGMFAVMMLVTGPEAILSELVAARPRFEESLGIHCYLAPTQTGSAPDLPTWTFSVSGLDRPGIVAKVSDQLARRGVNVTSFLSRIEYAPLTGTPLFVLEAECRIPAELTKADLQEALRGVCEKEGLELIDEE